MEQDLSVNLLIFPNQLFAKHPGLSMSPARVVLVEDSLFFGDPHHPMMFHKQKLWLHRATMKRYEWQLKEQGFSTLYLEYNSQVDVQMDDPIDSPSNSLLRHLETISQSTKLPTCKILVAEPADFLLEKRLRRFCDQLGIDCQFLPSPQFINSREENAEYRQSKKRWFMGDFYKYQRRRLDVLMEGDQPSGGKWSFDEDNRKKVPKKLLGDIPELLSLKRDSFDREAVDYVRERFPDNPGSLEQLYYPTSHADAKKWLKHFLKHCLSDFGPYEDAIVQDESWLWHSVLTPALNTGLLTPSQVVKETLAFSKKNSLPINSLEGFLRQIIGWREFIRATYEDHGVQMRTTNHWKHLNRMPDCFYDGSTGILPIDDAIERILKTGYCHHIERLMVLGGFMFLCEFDPDEIYRWFMEMFVDSYDWVMVPNAYSMSQHADGGLITTKPYFSGSSYVRKMSHYKLGPWCEIWDGLYWRWISKNREKLAQNPRWAMMCSMVRKMDPSKLETHIKNAEQFLKQM